VQPLLLWKSIEYYIFWVWVCGLRYPARNAHAPYCIAICGLSGCTILCDKQYNYQGKSVLNTKCVFWFSLQLLSKTFLVLSTIHRDTIRNVYWWPVLLYQVFPHYLVNGAILGKHLLNTKCVFWFSLQLLSETFLVLSRIHRDMIKNVYWWPVLLYQDFPHYLVNGATLGKHLPNTKRVFWVSLQDLSETFVVLSRNERDIIKNLNWSSCTGFYCPTSIKLDFSRYIFRKVLKYQITWKSVQWEQRWCTRTDGHKWERLKVAFANACEEGRSFVSRKSSVTPLRR